MSHFTLLVVGDNIDEQLAPFNEQPEEDSPYLKFVIEYTKEEAEKYFQERLNDGDHEEYRDKSLNYFMREYRGYNLGYNENDEHGYGHMRNPNAKWDWWIVGGRWRGYFKLKPDFKHPIYVGDPGVFDNGKTHDTDEAIKSDIDWEGMKQAKIKNAEDNWDKYEKELKSLELSNEKDDSSILSTRYMYNIYKDDDRESYIKRLSSYIATFAILKDGVWHEKGNMGWWGIVSDAMEQDKWNEFFNKTIDELPDDTLLTLVDCHI